MPPLLESYDSEEVLAGRMIRFGSEKLLEDRFSTGVIARPQCLKAKIKRLCERHLLLRHGASHGE